jgi:aminodeoxyfutalosine deaminase
MIRYRASWVLPVARAPLRDGWVLVDSGRIVGLGDSSGPDGIDERDLGEVALLPGLVNAHTHLELSYLRNEIGPEPEFVSWVRRVMAARRRRADPAAPEIVNALRAGIDEAVRYGTALAGDISNTLVSVPLLSESPLASLVFYELLRFNPIDPEAMVEAAWREVQSLARASHVRASLAAHAPYSVSPRLFQAIRRAVGRTPSLPWSVHLAESGEEQEFIKTGGGPWRTVLEDLGVWDRAWTAPAVSPAQYLDDAGLLDSRLLAVHGVQHTEADMARLRQRGTTVVACPRSNRYTGAGTPPISAFYAAGLRVAIGTDSLASTPDLSVFSELAALRSIAPEIPASVLIASATREGARALGFDADYGTIEPGKSSRLLAVAVPRQTTDVEEYLVSGIGPNEIRWVEEDDRQDRTGAEG